MKERTLQLWVNRERLGTLKESAPRRVEFRYDPAWIQAHPALPISRQLPVQEDAHRGDVVETYLKNLLPDSEAVLNRIAAIHRLRHTDAFSLLEVIGQDCVGALRFLTEDAQERSTLFPLQREPISTLEIEELVRNLKSAPFGQHADDDFFRISIAGVQEKTALLKMNGKWFKPKGPTPTTHIIKPAVDLDFEGVSVPITPENEWLCLKICGLFGLRVAHASVETFGEEKVLVVERFDRAWSQDKSYLERLIQEDFCQATGTPPHMKYESKGGPGVRNILDILSEAKDPLADRYHFFKTQVVFFLLAAIDGHAKNFSIQWSDSGLSLAPLYDILSAEPLVARKKLARQKIALAMAVEGKNRHYRISEISRRHWEETAKRAKIGTPGVTKLFDEIISVAERLPERMESHLPKGFPSDIVDPILEGVRNRLKTLK